MKTRNVMFSKIFTGDKSIATRITLSGTNISAFGFNVELPHGAKTVLYRFKILLEIMELHITNADLVASIFLDLSEIEHIL